MNEEQRHKDAVHEYWAKKFDDIDTEIAGQRIEAGQVILSGSFIRPVECPKGSVIDADFGPFGRVGCTFA